YVCQNLQLEAQAALLAFLAVCELPWRAVGAGFEVQIAQPTLAARCQRDLLAVPVEVEQQFIRVGIVDAGAYGYLESDIGSGCAVLIGATPVFAVFGPVQSGIAKVDERIDVAVGNCINATATATVGAVGAALGSVFFAANARRAMAACAGNDFDGCCDDEIHGGYLERITTPVQYKEPRRGRRGASSRCDSTPRTYSAGTTDTVPLFRAPL